MCCFDTGQQNEEGMFHEYIFNACGNSAGNARKKNEIKWNTQKRNKGRK
jgi:hypothetical protein